MSGFNRSSPDYSTISIIKTTIECYEDKKGRHGVAPLTVDTELSTTKEGLIECIGSGLLDYYDISIKRRNNEYKIRVGARIE